MEIKKKEEIVQSKYQKTYIYTRAMSAKSSKVRKFYREIPIKEILYVVFYVRCAINLRQYRSQYGIKKYTVLTLQMLPDEDCQEKQAKRKNLLHPSSDQL